MTRVDLLRKVNLVVCVLNILFAVYLLTKVLIQPVNELETFDKKLEFFIYALFSFSIRIIPCTILTFLKIRFMFYWVLCLGFNLWVLWYFLKLIV